VDANVSISGIRVVGNEPYIIVGFCGFFICRHDNGSRIASEITSEIVILRAMFFWELDIFDTSAEWSPYVSIWIN
jgi:hypothetical protein